MNRVTEELEPVGFGIAAVHTEHERELARKVGAKELPHMVMVIDGKVAHYKDRQISMISMLEFVRRKFPYKMVEVVDDSSAGQFIDGWRDNRVRALYFGHVSVDGDFQKKKKKKKKKQSSDGFGLDPKSEPPQTRSGPKF